DFLSNDRLDLTHHPDAFWGWHPAAAESCATAKGFDACGFDLPESLRTLYRCADGGPVAFSFVPQRDDPEFTPIPSKRLLASTQFVTLAELSDRLEFSRSAVQWRRLWPNADRLLVLSAHFESALMLDYRDADAPTVLWVENLDRPSGTTLRWSSFDALLDELRHPARSRWGISSPLGDITLSALRSRPDTLLDTTRPGVDEARRQAAEERLALRLPTVLRDAYVQHDGGRVVFNYLPPQIVNPHGYRNFAPQQPEWEPLFAGALRELAEIQTLGALIDEKRHPVFHAMEKNHEMLVLEGAPGERMVVLDYRDAYRTKSPDSAFVVVFDGDSEVRRYENARSVFANLRAKRCDPQLTRPESEES
ncbi:MAG: SMI1/KNR4 family protein, partial [Myxococcota bacterium]